MHEYTYSAMHEYMLSYVGIAILLPYNWLRVFRRAKAACLCSGEGPKRETSPVQSEKCVTRCGSKDDEMRMITASFARVLERYPDHL